MPLFGKKEPNPSTPPKSSFGMLKESLFGSGPAPKKEAGDQKSPGLFGEKGYGTFGQQRGFARRAPYEPLPGTARRLGKQERVGLIKELQERAKKSGQEFGLTERAYRERILPQMKREKYQLHIAGKFNEEKELGRKIQQYEKWIKGA